MSATATSPSQVQLAWKASSGATGSVSYDVYRNGAHYAYAMSTTYKDVSVYPGTAYSYQVLGYDSSGHLSPLSAAVYVTLPMPASANPRPPLAAGYKLVYSNEFDSLDISRNWMGQFHDWYTSEYGAIVPVSSARASATDSVLSLDWLAGDGANDSAVASFDIGSRTGRAFRYGYFEASMSWSPVAGAWPAFWLLSLNSATANGQWGELDIFEGQGLQPGMFFGTVHNWTAVNGIRSSTANSPNHFSLGLATDFSQSHKYGVLWQPGSITWYFDNNPVLTAPEPAIMESQDVEMILCMAEGINWTPGNKNGANPADLKLRVDWVHVWQQAPSISAVSTNGIAFRGN